MQRNSHDLQNFAEEVHRADLQRRSIGRYATAKTRQERKRGGVAGMGAAPYSKGIDTNGNAQT